jgi:hypothetical protein
MRNVGEHIDDYALGEGQHKDVHRHALQVGSFDGTVYRWLRRELDIDASLVAAEVLFRAVSDSVKKRVNALGC